MQTKPDLKACQMYNLHIVVDLKYRLAQFITPMTEKYSLRITPDIFEHDDRKAWLHGNPADNNTYSSLDDIKTACNGQAGL